jgi:uncharacterized protein (TIGR04255 family)
MSNHSRPPDLPNFNRPPINEVVLSVQFRALSNFGNGHVGVLWSKFRKDYPELAEKPPIQAAFETFGGGLPSPQGIQIETLLAPPMSRFWFTNIGGNELIQVQQDRFLHNWRRREEEQIYPHYEAIRERFERELKIFETFLQEEKLGELKANQCEVTYINVIGLEAATNPHLALDAVTPLWAGTLSEEIALARENAQFQCRFILLEDDKPIGRVHVICTPALMVNERKPVIRLEITARAKPTDDSVAAALRLVDKERAYVVRMFAAVTTPDMHKLWERTDGGQC